MNWHDQLSADVQKQVANLEAVGYQFCWRNEFNVVQHTPESRGVYVIELYRNGRLQDYIGAVVQPLTPEGMVRFELFIARNWEIYQWLRQ